MQRHTLTRAAVLMVAFLAFAAVVSAGRLPASAEKLLIRKTQAQRIVGVSALRERMIGDFDYLGVEAAFEITWSFESLYYPCTVLRKRHLDPDWSHAELFTYGGTKIPQLFAMPDSQFLSYLKPWKT
jgi:hypothetical protein